MISVRLTRAMSLVKDRGFNNPENELYINPYHYSSCRPTVMNNPHSQKDKMHTSNVLMNNGVEYQVEETPRQICELIYLATEQKPKTDTRYVSREDL